MYPLLLASLQEADSRACSAQIRKDGQHRELVAHQFFSCTQEASEGSGRLRPALGWGPLEIRTAGSIGFPLITWTQLLQPAASTFLSSLL